MEKLHATYILAKENPYTDEVAADIASQWRVLLNDNNMDAVRHCWVRAASAVDLNERKWEHLSFPDLPGYHCRSMVGSIDKHSRTIDALWFLQFAAKYVSDEDLAVKIIDDCPESTTTEYPEIALDSIFTILATKTTKTPKADWLLQQIEAMPICMKTLLTSNTIARRRFEKTTTTARQIVAETIVLRFMPPITPDSHVGVYACVLDIIEQQIDKHGTMLVVMDTAGFVNILKSMPAICILQADFLLAYMAKTSMITWSIISGTHLLNAIKVISKYATRSHAWTCMDAISSVMKSSEWPAIYADLLKREAPSRFTLVHGHDEEVAS
jgi:hypothetical protein